LRGEHHAIGDAGTGRLLAAVEGDGHAAPLGLEALERIEPDADAGRNEGAEAAVHPRAEFDPLLRSLGAACTRDVCHCDERDECDTVLERHWWPPSIDASDGRS